MKKKLFKARVKIWFTKFLNNRLAVGLSVAGVLLISVSLILLAWHLQGKDVWAILQSPLFMFWYAIIVVAVITVVYFTLMRRRKGDK